MIIYFLMEQSGFIIVLGIYLLPILLFYGLPSSLLSDFITKKLKGMFRRVSALFIHLFLATLFVLILILSSEWERAILFTDSKNLLKDFFFHISSLSGSLFWCIDEFLRSKRAKDICEKIDDLKI